jgi:hypothetical protein
MAWVAFDRAIKAVEEFGHDGPVEQWRVHREALRREICERGFNRTKSAFVQEISGLALDASLLMVPLVGFLPANDERVVGTVAAIERELLVDGFVLRCRAEEASQIDGLPPGSRRPCGSLLRTARTLLATVTPIASRESVRARDSPPDFRNVRRYPLPRRKQRAKFRCRCERLKARRVLET